MKTYKKVTVLFWEFLAMSCALLAIYRMITDWGALGALASFVLALSIGSLYYYGARNAAKINKED